VWLVSRGGGPNQSLQQTPPSGLDCVCPLVALFVPCAGAGLLSLYVRLCEPLQRPRLNVETLCGVVFVLAQCVAGGCGLLILWRAFTTSLWWGLGVLVPGVGPFLFAVAHWRQWRGPATVAIAAVAVAYGARVLADRMAVEDWVLMTVANLGYFGFVWLVHW
ncbi:MAG: hypothetical protein LC104_17195, partial [Bacteroidales bacterium]|nr:hypothetical protein [Bacteroidales bacterium]